MSDNHKRILRRNSTDIIHNLNPDVTFIAELMQTGIFTEYDRQRIVSKDTDIDKSRQILHILENKSDESFLKFAQTLCNTIQCHLAEKLRPCGENTAYLFYNALSSY